MFRRKKKSTDVPAHTKQNCDEVLASEVCGCVNCLAVFPPDEIKEWVDPDEHLHERKEADRTAICPHCGEAMVLGDKSGHRVSPATLEQFRAHWRL